MDELIKQLDAGILPDSLNYTNDKHFEGVDISKIQYNAFYRSYDFYLNKFPKGFDNLPGFCKVIEHIQEKNKDNTPLQEIELKSGDNVDERRDFPDTSEQCFSK